MTTITYSKDLKIHQFSKEMGHCQRKIKNFDTARKSSLQILPPFNWLIDRFRKTTTSEKFSRYFSFKQ